MSLARNTLVQSSLTLGSRILGFVRDMALAARFGQEPMMDAFTTALMLPNMFRRLFAEGAFSAAFVPLFARELHGGGREAALTFARQAQAVLLVVLLPLSVLAILAMPWVMKVLAPGLADEATFNLAVDFGRITFPYLLFISLMSLYAGVLNGIERFAHVAATPILLNLTLIAAVLGLTPLLPNGGYAAAIGVTLSGIAQWLWLVWACRREDVPVGVVRPRLTERVRRLVILATPIAIGGGAQQINLVLDVVWASLMPAGAISALYYADRLAQLPLGVAGVAIGTALLPLLARNLSAGDETAAMDNQNRAVELGLLFALPAAVALWLLAEPIVRLLFERGQFTPADTLRTASALAAFAIGIPAFVAIKALTPGFFAREDTKTPLYTAVASIVVNVVLNVVFLYATSLQHVGIALASSLAGWLNVALLAMILISRGHWRPDARLLQRSFGIVLASAGMGVLLWLAMRRDASDLMVLAYCVGGGAIYAVLGMLLRVIRLDELRAAFRRPPGVKREAGDVD